MPPLSGDVTRPSPHPQTRTGKMVSHIVRAKSFVGARGSKWNVARQCRAADKHCRNARRPMRCAQRTGLRVRPIADSVLGSCAAETSFDSWFFMAGHAAGPPGDAASRRATAPASSSHRGLFLTCYLPTCVRARPRRGKRRRRTWREKTYPNRPTRQLAETERAEKEVVERQEKRREEKTGGGVGRCTRRVETPRLQRRDGKYVLFVLVRPW
jgi:hypothetical protein